MLYEKFKLNVKLNKIKYNIKKTAKLLIIKHINEGINAAENDKISLANSCYRKAENVSEKYITALPKNISSKLKELENKIFDAQCRERTKKYNQMCIKIDELIIEKEYIKAIELINKTLLLSIESPKCKNKSRRRG